MSAELKDIVVADERLGEVVDFDLVTDRAIVRPFPRRGGEALEPAPSFTAQGEVRIIRKHFDRELIGDRAAPDPETIAAWRALASRGAERALADRAPERGRDR